MNVTMQAYQRTTLHVWIILLLGIVVYLNSFAVPFVFDDRPNIVENQAIRGLDNFIDALRGNMSLLDDRIEAQFSTRAVGYLTFAVNYSLHGYSIIGYHVFNLIIHLLNGLLVYFIFKTLAEVSNSPRDDYSAVDTSGVFALFVALLFVCHPIQTQAVTYVVQRFTSLATFFCLCSVAAYLKSRLAEKSLEAGLYLAASVCAVMLAMKTKEFSMVLPVLLVLSELFFFKGTPGRRLFSLLPFLPTLAIIPWTLYTSTLSAGKALGAAAFEFGGSSDFSRLDYFITQLRVIVTYLRLLVFPVGLNLDHDQPVLRSFLLPEVVGSAVLLALLLVAGVLLWRVAQSNSSLAPQARLCSFGIFWFFITIAPESSFIKIKDLVFEHRLYLPSIGFFATVVALISMVWVKLAERGSRLTRLLWPVSVFVVLLLAIATYARNAVWQDELLLWQDVVEKSPDKARPHDSLAALYFDRGLFAEAISENRKSLAIKPASGGYLNIGNSYSKMNNPDEAIKAFNAALELDSRSAKAYNGLCGVYFGQKKYVEAQQACQTAVDLDRDYAEPHNLLGLTHLVSGEHDAALQAFRLAIERKPDQPNFHNNLAGTLFKAGRHDEALAEYRLVATLDPAYIGVYLDIGRVYLTLGRYPDAVNSCREALRFKPDYREAHELLDEIKRRQTVPPGV